MTTVWVAGVAAVGLGLGLVGVAVLKPGGGQTTVGQTTEVAAGCGSCDARHQQRQKALLIISESTE